MFVILMWYILLYIMIHVSLYSHLIGMALASGTCNHPDDLAVEVYQ